MFNTLPDMINSIVEAKACAIRTAAQADPNSATDEQLKYSIFVGVGVTTEGKLALMISYESPSRKRHVTEYEVSYYWFGETREIDVKWIRDD